MTLIYFSPVPWFSLPQRPHQLVKWFHDRYKADVLWINPYPTRIPQFRDMARIVSSNAMHQELPSWLRTVSPRALPIEPFRGINLVNNLLWADVHSLINRVVQSVPSIVIYGKPSRLGLSVLKDLHDVPVMFDVMDNFPFFYRGVSRRAMLRVQEQLIIRSTYVITSSHVMKHYLQGTRSDVCVVPNGIDQSDFPSVKFRRKTIGPRVFGYAGTLGSWLDWAWLTNLARLFPQYMIRLFGPVLVRPKGQLPSNVEILPPRSHQEALQEMMQFNIGLIPFLRNELTSTIDPIKYYEYRALGLPVLSTAFDEMLLKRYDHGTFISYNTDDVIEVVGRALEYEDTEDTITHFRSGNDWRTRFDKSILNKYIDL